MSVALTTLAFVVLLLPGVFFFIGLATFERLPREIIRSSVVSEIALATIIAIGLHTVIIVSLSALTGFRLSAFVAPLIDYASAASPPAVSLIAERVLPLALYILLTALVGFVLGLLLALGILRGPARFLAMHKWIYDIIDADRRRRIVTAFVMTNVIEDGRVLMYKGRVQELFLSTEGAISYVVLKNCARFYMTFEAGGLRTSRQYELFDAEREARSWEYLLIEGSHISNILFDPSPEHVQPTEEGAAALRRELKQRREKLRQRQRK
jgi:hypothetical protein